MIAAPLFSVITPSYCALYGLRETVASVAAQHLSSWEHLVIDGASEDGTAEWLQTQQDERLRWISERDSGVYEAMNKSLALAQGQFLLFLGAGDRLLPEVLAQASSFIATLPAHPARFIYGNVCRLTEGGKVGDGHFTASKLCVRNICHQAIFYERTIFDLLGNYETRYPVYADWAFNMRCFGRKEIARFYWPEVVAEFAGEGLSDRVQDFPFAEERVQLIRERLGRGFALRFRVSQKFQRGFRRWRGLFF